MKKQEHINYLQKKIKEFSYLPYAEDIKNLINEAVERIKNKKEYLFLSDRGRSIFNGGNILVMVKHIGQSPKDKILYPDGLSFCLGVDSNNYELVKGGLK